MKSIFLTAFSLALVLSGCGSGADDNVGVDMPISTLPDENTIVEEANETSSDDRVVKTITAIDGYLENAQVTADTNNNFQYDEEDLVLGRTDAQGKFDVPAEYSQSILFVTAIANETIDTSRGLVSSSFSLGMTGEDIVASPFTNMVIEILKKNPDLEPTTAKTMVVEAFDSLDASADILFEDYLAIDSEVAVAVTALGEILVDHNNLTSDQKLQVAVALSEDIQAEMDISVESISSDYSPVIIIPEDSSSGITVNSNYLPIISTTAKGLIQASIDTWYLVNTSVIDDSFSLEGLFEDSDTLTYRVTSTLDTNADGTASGFSAILNSTNTGVYFNQAPGRLADAGVEKITVWASDGKSENETAATFTLPEIYEKHLEEEVKDHVIQSDLLAPPSDPAAPVAPSDPDLPSDPNTSITNIGTVLPFTIPTNAISSNNPISQGEKILNRTGETSVYSNYTDNVDGIMLFSKYKLEDNESSLDVRTYTTNDTAKYDVYNVDEDLPVNYFDSIYYAVNTSLYDRVTDRFDIFTADEALLTQHGGSNAVNCVAAIDYYQVQEGDTARVLNTTELTAISLAQSTLSDPTVISPQAFNKVLRLESFNDPARRSKLVELASEKFDDWLPIFEYSQTLDELNLICAGSVEEYASFMKSITRLHENKKKTLEINITKESGITESYQDKIVIAGLDMDNVENSEVSIDVIDNLVIKNMILNKIFSWNGDGYSYLSKHSFKNGAFTGLYEGIASYLAYQKYSSRDTTSTCNPAKLSDACTYPQVYGDYGLMIAYMISADTTFKRLDTEDKLAELVISLANYNTNGCGITWESVLHDQVKMSDHCIEKAFDETNFIKPDGSSLTWDDLQNNWFSLIEEYRLYPQNIPRNGINETLIFQ